jgi:hypothetical protein
MTGEIAAGVDVGVTCPGEDVPHRGPLVVPVLDGQESIRTEAGSGLRRETANCAQAVPPADQGAARLEAEITPRQMRVGLRHVGGVADDRVQ